MAALRQPKLSLIRYELELESRLGIGMGLGSTDALPDFRINHREEGVRILYFGVDVGDVQPVHFGHRGPVNGGSSHYEAFVFARLLCLAERFVETIGAGDLRNRIAAEVEYYVFTALKRPERKRKVCGAAHYHRISGGDCLEVLEVFRDVPGKVSLDTYSIVVCDCDDKTFFHTAAGVYTATGALIAGQGS